MLEALRSQLQGRRREDVEVALLDGDDVAAGVEPVDGVVVVAGLGQRAERGDERTDGRVRDGGVDAELVRPEHVVGGAEVVDDAVGVERQAGVIVDERHWEADGGAVRVLAHHALRSSPDTFPSP